MIRDREFDARRPWVFSHRHYSPGGWRVPRFIWTRRWNYYASGKGASTQLSYLEGWLRRLRGSFGGSDNT